MKSIEEKLISTADDGLCVRDKPNGEQMRCE